jgi:hypothetical protein
LIDENLSPSMVKMIGHLWLYPPLIIAVTIPLGFINVYPVYILWFLMPVISYAYSIVTVGRHQA